MKKQYLISLLGLAALSISFGNGFSSLTSSSTNVVNKEATSATNNFSEEELNTLEEYENEFPDYSIEQIDMSAEGSAAVVNDGIYDHLYVWGWNYLFGLGLDENEGEYPAPQEITELPKGDIEDVALGFETSYAVVDNELYGWGWPGASSPTKITIPSGDIEQISTTGEMDEYELDILINDEYGDHLYVTNITSTPGSDYDPMYPWHFYEVENVPPGNIEQITKGFSYRAAIINDGISNDNDSLYFWETDPWTTDYQKTPQLVTGLPPGDIEQITMGNYHYSAVVDGDLYTWGSNKYGQLGLGNNISYDTPQPVNFLNDKGNVEQVSLGNHFSSAIVNEDNGDHLYTWGLNRDGQLGIGVSPDNPDDSESPYYSYNTPQLVTDLPSGDIEQISTGVAHSGAVVNGVLYTWGFNRRGELGVGTVGEDDREYLVYDTPQEVWKQPYIYDDSFYSSATPIGNDLDKVQIEYGFETNLDVQNVTILLEDNNPGEFYVPPINKIDYPEFTASENEYKGEATIDNLIPGANYIYTVNLNYLNVSDEEKTITIDQGEIINSVVPVTPTLEDINLQNVHQDTVEINFDLDLGHDQSNTPYVLEEIIVDDYLHIEQRIYTEDENPLADEAVDGSFIIDDQGKGTVKVTDITPDITYNWDVTFILNSPWEENNIEIKSELDEFTTISAYEKSSIKNEGNVKVKSNTEASVDYKIELGENSHGQEAKIKKVEWKTKNYKTLARSDSKDVTGTLTARTLTTNTIYNDTFIVATMEDGTKTNQKVLNPFKTYSLQEESILSADPVNVISSTEASVTYNIEHGKDVNGKPIHVVRVKWMDGNNKLASSKKASTTLTTDKLDPYQEYANTTLVAEMSDGTSTNIIELDPFTTLSEQEISTISADPVEVISSTKASVDYNIILGVDDYGEGVTISNVKWMDGGNVLASSTSKELDGTLTAKDLDPNTTYSNTTIVATMDDETSTNIIELASFKTLSGAKQSTITVEAPQVTGITSASVKYEVNPGKDADANDIFAINVQWMNVTQDGTQELASSRRGATTLTTDKLEPDQPYDETYLIVTMSDGSKTEKTYVDPFLTWTNAEESTITASDVEVISPTEARIAYNVTPGLNTYGNDISVDEVKWMDGDEKLASSNKANGVLTTNRLESNQEYNDTFLIAYMSDETTATIDVNNFNDKNVAPEVGQLHHVQVDYDDDILDVKGSIDTNGAAINDIYFIKDEQRIHTDYLEGEFNQASNSDNVTYDMWTKEYLGEKNLDGSADLEGYSIAIEYGNELFEEPISLATTDDHSSIAEDQAIEKELGYLLEEEKTSFSAAAISLMTIGAILIIGLIGAGGFGGYYLYKKHQA